MKRYGARNLKIVLILLFVLMLIATVLPLPNALAETNTGSISGVVTNPDGGLMPGIGVRLYTSDWERIAYLRTDSNGQYTFSSLGAGSYMVRFEPYEYNNKNNTTYTYQYYQNSPVSGLPTLIPVSEGQVVANINAQLHNGGSISGKIYGPNNQPLSGIRVTAIDPTDTYSSSFTTSDGEYFLKRIPATNYLVQFNPAEYNAQYGTDYMEQWYCNRLESSDADQVTVGEAQTADAIDAILKVTSSTVREVRAEAFGDQISLSWTSSSEAQSYNIYRTTYSYGQYDKIGSSKTTSFTDPNLPLKTQYWYKIVPVTAAGEGIYSAPVSATTRDTASQDPLDNWHTRTPAQSGNMLKAVTYHNNTFVAVGGDGAIMTSPEGVNWTDQTSGTTQYLYSITCGKNLLMAVDWNGGVYSSGDGFNWSKATPIKHTVNAITYGNNLFVTVGYGGRIATSPDGATWTEQTSGVTDILYNVKYCKDMFIAVGKGGIILTSPDGVTWTNQVSGTTNELYAAGYGNGTYVVAGGNGTVLSSPDGSNWHSRASGTTYTLYDVGFGNDTLILVGENGTILTSADGIVWSSRIANTGSSLYGVINANNTFLIVGSGGIIVQSNELNSPLSIMTDKLDVGMVGVSYSMWLSASGGILPYTWSASGLPAGLDIDPQTGFISGIPTDEGTFMVNITAADSTENSYTSNFSLVVDAAINGVILNKSSLALRPQQTEQLTATVTSSGSNAGITWSIHSQSSDNVVTVSPTGLVTGIKDGTAVIKATSTADSSKHAECNIRVIALVTTIIAGNGAMEYSGDGGPAINAALESPKGIAFDNAGNMYITGWNQFPRIRKVDSSGIITTMAGNGTQGYSGDGGLVGDAVLFDPNGVVFDIDGNMYIADGDRIRKVDNSGIITTIAGMGDTGDGEPAFTAKLYARAIAIDDNGNIYIADGNRIRKIDNLGIITTIAGTETKGYSGDDGPASSATLCEPSAVVVDNNGNLYIADRGNHRIRRVDTSGFITTVAGTGTSGYSGDGGVAIAAQLSSPAGVAVDNCGNIYISDSGNDRIRKINSSGIISTVFGNSGELFGPNGVALDNHGNLYIADSGRNYIRKVALATSTINPALGSFDKKDDKQKDVTTVIALNDDNLVSITNGTETLSPGTDYIINSNSVTIKKEYLATQAAGKTRMIFNFNAGCSQILTIEINDTSNGINIDANRSTSSIDKMLRPGGTSTVTATLKDISGNLIRNASINLNIAVNIQNVNPTNMEIYSVAGQVCSETCILTRTLTSNDRGQIRFDVSLPSNIDSDDGISILLRTSSGTDIGRSFSYPEKWDLQLSYGTSYHFLLAPASDEGFFVIGDTSTLLKVDSYGNHLWEKTLERPALICPIANGGCMVATDVWGGGCTYETIYVAAYDTRGQLIWENTVLDYSSITINKAMVCSDGGYILTGYVDTGTDCAVWSGFVLKLDTQGKKQWDTLLGDDYDYHCNDIIETKNGFDILLPGSIKSLDNQGNITADYPLEQIQIYSFLKSPGEEWFALAPGSCFDMSGTARVNIQDGIVAYANKIVDFTLSGAECLDDGGYLLFGKSDSGNPAFAVVDPTGNRVLERDNYSELEIKGATKLSNGEYLIVTFDPQSLKYYATKFPSSLRITDINPIENKTLVSVRGQVKVDFSGILDPNSVNASTFRVTDDQGNRVGGITSVSKNCITFKPSGHLKYSQLYIVDISTGIADICGKHLSANYQWSFTTESAEVSQTKSVWPISDGRDPQRTSLSPYKGPDSIHLQKIIGNYGDLENSVNGYIFVNNLNNIIIGKDNNAKVCSFSIIYPPNPGSWTEYQYDFNVSSFTSTGQKAWNTTYLRKDSRYATSIIEERNGVVIVGTYRNYAQLSIDDGSIIDYAEYCPDIIGPDGTHFVNSGGGLLKALKPDGTTKWQFDKSGAKIAVGCDGAIYTCRNDNGYLICLNADGTPRFESSVNGLLLVDPNNTVYGYKRNSNNNEYMLCAVSHNGMILWSTKTCCPKYYCLGPDGTVYLTDSMWLEAISLNGKLKWKKQLHSSNTYITQPIVDAGGRIYYFSGSDKCFYILDGDGNELCKTPAPLGISWVDKMRLDKDGHIWAFVKYSTESANDYGLAIFGEADYGPITGLEDIVEIAKRDPKAINIISKVSDPVDTATGAHLLERKLLGCHGVQEVNFDVEYNSLLLGAGPLGRGWGHNYETWLEEQTDGSIKAHWTANRWNQFTMGANNQYVSSEQATQYDVLTRNADNSYTLTRKDKNVYQFDQNGRLLTIQNKYKQAIDLDYNTSGQLTSITEPITGKYLTLQYNATGNIEKAVDNLNRQVQFAYNDENNLTGITDADGNSITYTYNSQGQVLSAVDGKDQQIFVNTYDDKGRVSTQDDGVPGNQIATFAYDETTQNGKIITTYTDRNGHSQVYVHDSSFNLLSVTDGNGNTRSFKYDRFGNRINEIDPHGNTTKYNYDDRGNMLQCADSAGNVTSMDYDAADNCLTTTRPDRKITSNTYDSNNHLLEQTDPAGNRTTYTYNDQNQQSGRTLTGQGTTNYTYENGMLKTMTDPENVAISYSYDEAGRIASITDGKGNMYSFTYNNTDRPLSITDPLGHTLTYSYDERGNILTQTDARGNITRYSYNGNNKMTSKTDALGNMSSYEYDGEDRLVKITDPLGHSTRYAYDNAGRLIGVTDALGNTVTIQYDANNNILTVLDAANNPLSTNIYDNLNQLINSSDALGNTTTREYDSLGNIIRITDPKNRVSNLRYDDLNRLISVTDPLAGISKQTFDAVGNLLSLTDPNNNRQTFTYDQAGRLVKQMGDDGSNTIYEYNEIGQLIKHTNGRGQISTCTYNETGRLVKQVTTEGDIDYTYDENGNLLSVNDSNGTITRTYDDLNRVTSYKDSRGNTIGYQYDAVGNLIKLTYPDGKVVSYDYDAANRLNKVSDWNGRVTTYEYDPTGRLIQNTLPDGSITTFIYDEAGHLLQQKDIDKNSNIIAQYDFTYDQIGNILSENSSGMQMADSDTVEMVYGAGNRLSNFNSQEISYDADGNIIQGPLNGEIQSFAYDSRNRLVQAGNTSYSYDAEGNRISMVNNDSQTNFIINPQAELSQVLIREQDGQNTYYVYGLGLIGEETADNFSTYHYDRRGSTIAITDIAGEITDTYIYGPYGELVTHTGSNDTPFLYDGRDTVSTDINGLYYMRARYYNPTIKRFMSKDVLLGSINKGQSLNRYSFVTGQPVFLVDPTGLDPVQDTKYYAVEKFIEYTTGQSVPVGTAVSVYQDVGEISKMADRTDLNVGQKCLKTIIIAGKQGISIIAGVVVGGLTAGTGPGAFFAGATATYAVSASLDVVEMQLLKDLGLK